MITIAICEDSPHDALKLKRCIDYYFTNYPAQYRVILFDSANSFYYNMKPGLFNIVFFDIFLGKSDGIELSRKLRQIDKSVIIIFTSSSKADVFRCFDSEPLSYLLKPFLYEQLYLVLEKAVKKLKSNVAQIFSFSNGHSTINIPLSEIIFFESKLRIITINCIKEQYSFYGKLSDVEKQINSSSFVRCHQSYLVNMGYVKRVDSTSIYTTCGDHIQISRSKSQNVKEKLLEYVGSML